MATTTNNTFEEFNKFQTYFYTSVQMFEQFTNFEIKRNAVMLLTNIGKGFPVLSMQILDIYSPDVKAIESPAIIKALQRAKFCNGFSRARMPNYVYYKNMKPKKESKSKVVKTKKISYIEFDDTIRDIIQSKLLLDNKDYMYLLPSKRIQDLGKHLLNNINET